MNAPYLVYFNNHLIYDPVFGVLRWRTRPVEHFDTIAKWRIWNSKYSGKVAGYKKVVPSRPGGRGGIRVEVDTKKFYAHILIWEMVHGYKPAKGLDIDHINGNPWDNRLSNLRVVTRTQNLHNVKTRSNSIPGVSMSNSGTLFKASITIKGKRNELGAFDTIEKALAARKAAEKAYYDHNIPAPGL